MSARDDLDRFDGDWERHIRWRKDGHGKYVSARDGHGAQFGLPEMPNELRAAVLRDLEATVGALVDAKRAALRAELIERAKEEARRTLSELDALPDKMPGTYAAVVYDEPAKPIKLAARESAKTQDAELSDWEARRVETRRIVGGRLG